MRKFSLPESQITPKSAYLNRRRFLALGAAGAGALLLGGREALASSDIAHGAKLAGVKPNTKYDTDEKKTPFEKIAGYNNFYEFGTGKEDPSENAHTLKTRPWTVSVGGECKKPQKFAIDDLIKSFPIEERVYRMRCVEA